MKTKFRRTDPGNMRKVASFYRILFGAGRRIVNETNTQFRFSGQPFLIVL